MALAKLPDDDDAQGYIAEYEAALLISYQSGFSDGKRSAQRPWVGLTNEEVQTIWREVIGWGDPSHDDEDLVRAIEAKLKERNT